MNPSLLLIPDRYKAAKLYSQIPDSGAGDLDFARASVATRVNASGLIESVASGVPRLDYTGGGCPSLLLEPQRTNLITFSEQFDNAAWTKFGSSASANQAVSPDGFTNGDKLLPNNGIALAVPAGGIFTAGAAAYLRSGALTLTAASYTFSVFVKKAELDHVQLRSGTSTDLTAGGSGNIVNLNNGTSSVANTVQDYGNGWYRVSHTFTATAATWYVGLWFWNTTSLVANGSQGILSYGAQLETGSAATSYIPTTTASATRLADVASKTGISSLIGQSEGVLYCEVNLANININQERVLLNVETNTSNRMTFLIDAANLLWCNFLVAGSFKAITSAATWQLGINKVAVAYANNDAALFLNGQLLRTSNNISVPSTTRIQIGSFQGSLIFLSDKINTAALYTTRLSNAELAQLTAL